MGKYNYLIFIVFSLALVACNDEGAEMVEVEPLVMGSYAVGTTNMEIADEYLAIGDDEMHDYLIGAEDESGRSKYFSSLLKHPDAAFLTHIKVPNENDLYGAYSGQSYPVVSYIAYPAEYRENKNTYAFPYRNAQFGKFEDMLLDGEIPTFPEPDTKYPLIIVAHGSQAHGIYEVGHVHKLASHGYIVAVISYGDHRIKSGTIQAYLRPLITQSILDNILADEHFGLHIDTDNIGISGFSFGGYTALAIAGGDFMGNANSAKDSRIKAALVAAPWVGENSLFSKHYIFGEENASLSNVDIPVIALYGSKDMVTTPGSILPATKLLSGPTYVIQLVDQGHDLEEGSWFDRDSWELMFFSAYLKNDESSLKQLKIAGSMKGGNKDNQLFDYQRLND